MASEEFSSPEGALRQEAEEPPFDIVAISCQQKLAITSNNEVLKIVAFVADGEVVDLEDATHAVVKASETAFYTILLEDYETQSVN